MAAPPCDSDSKGSPSRALSFSSRTSADLQFSSRTVGRINAANKCVLSSLLWQGGKRQPCASRPPHDVKAGGLTATRSPPPPLSLTEAAGERGDHTSTKQLRPYQPIASAPSLRISSPWEELQPVTATAPGNPHMSVAESGG